MSLFRNKEELYNKRRKIKTIAKSRLHSTRKLSDMKFPIQFTNIGATKFFKQTAFYIGDTV